MNCSGEMHNPTIDGIGHLDSDHVERNSNHSVEEKLEDKPFGPLTQSEAENLQREANEDTTRSEDLRLFLKEMREKLKEEQQQQQQQPSLPVVNVGPSGNLGHPGAVPTELGPNLQQGPRRSSVTGNPIMNKSAMQEHRISLVDFPNPDTPPDGGWGWIVVLSSFCCMILVDGVCVSYGLLLNPQCGYSTLKVLAANPTADTRSSTYAKSGLSARERIVKPTLGTCVAISELGEAMGTQDRALLLTPGALLLGVYLLLGPLISALTNQFDFRPVAMTGAAVSTIAMFISSFANSIETLVASLGILGGVGFALIYLPAIATVGHWFQERRPLAVGLALCGSGVGCLLGAQVVPRLVDWFTWRGALIIMAAVSFQCMSLIVLFRPMEMHLRINQVKRARQTAQESVRRAAAARRAATERLALEARHFKRMVIAKASAERAMALQLQQQQLLAVKKSANAMMTEGQSDSEMKRSDAKLQANTSFALGTRGRPNMVLMRTAQGGRVFTVQNPSRAPPPEPARPNPNTGGWLRNRTHSGRVGQTKRTPSRRIATYRGSIMQRIIEEKRRQRTISVGSLDGMVITRDNELIEASLAANCDRPLISSSAIQRISEAVARKIEMKLLQQQSTAIDGAGTTPSTATPGALGNHTFSRSHLRVSLPHVVQEYIQSQLSLTFQQQQQHRQSLCQIGDVQVASTFSPPASLVSPTSQTRPIPNPDLVSIQRDSTVIPNTTGVASIVLCTGDTAPVFGQSTPVNTAFSRSFWDAAQMGPISDPQPSQAITNLRSGNANPSSCPSESVSLRRNTSNVSLESRLHGGGASILTGGTSVAGPYDGAELLDNEIKAEINARLRRELARPQYKKDLFFTGSVAQLESSLVPSGLPSSPGLGRVIAIGPDKRSICATTAPLGHSNAAFKSSCLRASMQLVQQLNDHGGQDLHNSQTNLSLATSIGAGGNTFIPPAPCPAVQPPVIMCLPVHTTQTTPDAADALSTHQQDTVSTGFASVGAPSPRINNAAGADVLSANLDPADSAYHRVPSTDPMSGEDDGVDDGVGDGNDDLGIGEDDLDGDDADDDVEMEAGTRRPFGCCPFNSLPFWCMSCTSSLLDTFTPMRSFIYELLSPWILLSSTFAFMLLSSTASMMGLSVPYLLLPDLLAELNWPLTDSGFAISAIAVGNTVGRLIVTLYIDKGWSSSYRWADCLWLNNISLLITSIAVALMPVSRIYYSALVLVCVLFGFFSAVFVSLKSILVVELLGLDRLTNSFGYMLLMQGIAAAVGTPFAGYLRELQLSKHLPHDMLAVHVCPVHHATSMGFYFAAGCLFLACLLSCPLRRLSLKECRTIVLEAHHPYAANPMFEFGPGHTALDAHIPSQTGDTELHPGLPEPNGIANCVTNFSDAFTKNAGDFPHEQAGVAFTSNQNSENQPGIALQPAQVAASQAASVSGSPGSACPGLLDVGSPCMLATIDENLPVVGGNVGTLDTVDLGIPSAVSPNAENLSVFDGLATSMLGVGALVLPASGVAASAACTVPTAMNPQLKKVEVMTVQEEPGLEPVAEEEEEYEEEEEPAPDIGEEVEGGSSAGPSDTGAHTDSTGLSIVSPSSDHPENSASEEQVPAKKWKRRKRKVGHLAHHPTSEIRLPLTESGDPETGLPATSEKIDIEGPNTD